jgi:hypothetical protein
MKSWQKAGFLEEDDLQPVEAMLKDLEDHASRE